MEQEANLKPFLSDSIARDQQDNHIATPTKVKFYLRNIFRKISPILKKIKKRSKLKKMYLKKSISHKLLIWPNKTMRKRQNTDQKVNMKE
jgi:hypothetical protein